MTPCEKLGYKVGDEFEVVDPAPCDPHRQGVRVKLIADDGSNSPYFYPVNQKYQDGFSRWCFSLTSVRPLAITLALGDYVSTDGITDAEYHAVAAAFMAVGADHGESPEWSYAKDGYLHGFGWNHDGGLYHGNHRKGVGYWAAHESECRHLTINQVLNATNAPGKPPQQESTPMTVIDTLHEAKRQRDEAAEKLETAEAVLDVALDAVQTELGVGFIVKEAGDSDLAEQTLERLRSGEETTHSLDDVERELGRVDSTEDMTDPSNWRAGDVLKCVHDKWFTIEQFTVGDEYKMETQPRCLGGGKFFADFEDDEGDTMGAPLDHFTFVRRP